MTHIPVSGGRFDPDRGWFDEASGWFDVVFESDSETSAGAAERRLDDAGFEARLLTPAETGVRRRWFVAVPEERAGKARKALQQERARRTAPSWETVWQGDGEAAAIVVANSLRGRGIDARAIGGHAVARGYPHAWQRGTWAVTVRGREAESAREVLEGTGEGSNVVYGDRKGSRSTGGSRGSRSR